MQIMAKYKFNNLLITTKQTLKKASLLSFFCQCDYLYLKLVAGIEILEDVLCDLVGDSGHLTPWQLHCRIPICSIPEIKGNIKWVFLFVAILAIINKVDMILRIG